jgi:mRNA degradation ribonuclease J1/J2
MLQAFERYRVPLEVQHVSGHAYLADLRCLVDAVQPVRVVPVHTNQPSRYYEYFPRVDERRDGSVWEV